MDVSERSAGDQCLNPVDEPDAIDLDLVELWPLEDPVAFAGSRVAVEDHARPASASALDRV